MPETWDAGSAPALIVALHGGHGHGRDCLWSWLREARARGMLVLAPTSRDRTWSIMGGEDVDADNLRAMVASVADRYAVDRSRVLLTGMSDGATYALLCGLGDEMPFTHLAPMCGVLHPYLLAGGIAGARDRRSIWSTARGLDVSAVHRASGARDPARGGRALGTARSRTSPPYPRDENPARADWLTAKA